MKTTHDVAERLQGSLKVCDTVFIIDYDEVHDVSDEHNTLYDPEEPKALLVERVREKLRFKSRTEEVANV